MFNSSLTLLVFPHKFFGILVLKVMRSSKDTPQVGVVPGEVGDPKNRVGLIGLNSVRHLFRDICWDF